MGIFSKQGFITGYRVRIFQYMDSFFLWDLYASLSILCDYTCFMVSETCFLWKLRCLIEPSFCFSSFLSFHPFYFRFLRAASTFFAKCTDVFRAWPKLQFIVSYFNRIRDIWVWDIWAWNIWVFDIWVCSEKEDNYGSGNCFRNHTDKYAYCSIICGYESPGSYDLIDKKKV